LFERFRAIDGSVQRRHRVQPDRIQAHDQRRSRKRDRTLGQRHLPRLCSACRWPSARGFSAESDQPTDTPAAVISDAFWLRRFGRDPSVLDRTITLDGRAVAIVGVTAAEFTGLIPGNESRCDDADRGACDSRAASICRCTTRGPISRSSAASGPASPRRAALAPSTPSQQYMSEDENSWIAKGNPDAFANAVLMPAAHGSGCCGVSTRTALNVLMGMVAIVLLIASVNVANLLLVRSAARSKEVAIRMCVGGGRARLIRQFLTESLLLRTLGGRLAIVFAQWGTAAIMSLFNAAETPLAA
jgi:hypothetical protein